MSTTDVLDVKASVQPMNPVMAPVLGLVVYLGSVVIALAADAGKPSKQDLSDWVFTLAIAGVATGVAIAFSHRALTRGAGSMARTSLLLGVVAVLTIVVFYFGFPCVFGATAVGLGWASRPAGGRPSAAAITGMLLGALALISGAITMVVG